MCTLVLAWRVFPDAPVVVAANRDEAADRPSEPPARQSGEPAYVAPRDAETGGTWTGYNEHGLYVGVANRWTDRDLDGERSRGLLVADAIRTGDAKSALGAVEAAVEADEYDGFELVLADATAAFLVEWDGRLRVTRLDPGVHVVVNVGAALGGGGAHGETLPVGVEGAPAGLADAAEQQADAARRLRGVLAPEPGERASAWLDRAATALADHEHDVCVHGDGFGTRSSSLVSLGNRREYRFADGPPCETPYRRVDEQV